MSLLCPPGCSHPAELTALGRGNMRRCLVPAGGGTRGPRGPSRGLAEAQDMGWDMGWDIGGHRVGAGLQSLPLRSPFPCTPRRRRLHGDKPGEDFCSIQHRDPRLILPWVQRRVVLSSARPAPGLQPLAGGSSGRPGVLRTRPGRERRSPATWEAQKCGTTAWAGSLPFPIRRTKPAVVWSRVSMAEICFLCVKCFGFFLFF